MKLDRKISIFKNILIRHLHENKTTKLIKTSKKRAVSSIVGAFFFLALLVGAFGAFILFMNANTDFLETQLKISEQEAQKTQEKFDLAVCVNDFNNQLFVEVSNTGSNPIKVPDIYFENLTGTDFPITHLEIDFEDAFVPEGATKNVIAKKSLIMNPGNYDIKIVSKFGTKKSDTLTVLEKVAPGTFKGVFTTENINAPTYMAFGPAPNYDLYVSNVGSDAVNRYKFPSGDFIVNVFVNLDVGGLDEPTGLVFGSGASQSNDLFVISSGDDEVHRYDKTTGDFVKAFVDSSNNGGLDGGWDLAFDSEGRLYVTNSNPGGEPSSDDEILRYTSSGAFESIFYDAADSPPLDDPRGLAFDSSGNLYVSNDDDDNIIKINSNGVGTIFADSADGINNARDLVFNSTGYLFVALGNPDDSILTISTTGIATVFANAAKGIDDPQYLAVDASNNIYVSNDDDDNVVKCTPGGVCTEFIARDTSIFERPRGLIFDTSGNLYLSNNDDDVVDRFKSGGSFDIVFVKKIGALSDPQAIYFGPDGNLYVAAEGSDGIFRHFTSTFSKSGVFVGSGDNGLNDPVGLVWGSDGKLYVTKDSGGTEEVYRYNQDSGFNQIFIPDGSQIDEPEGITFDSSGNLYIASSDDNEVLKYNSGGGFVGNFIPGGLGGLDNPREVVIGPDGKYYVSSFDDDEILRFNSDGTFDLVFVSAGSGGLNDPVGLVFGPNQDLYVASRSSNQILRYQGPVVNTDFTCALEGTE